MIVPVLSSEKFLLHVFPDCILITDCACKRTIVEFKISKEQVRELVDFLGAFI